MTQNESKMTQNDPTNLNQTINPSKSSILRTFSSFTSNLTTPNVDDSDNSQDEGDFSYRSDTSWPEIEIPGSWGSYGLEENPWNDETKQVVTIKAYDELELTEDEENGILTERIIACCSTYLDKSPMIGKYVLCKADLSEKNLKDISILTFHHYLQYLNLSNNKLTTLKPLGQLPFLMYLNVSNNTLTEVLNFKPPFNLTYVNFSNNYVDVIDDLSKFWSLIYLDLSHNRLYYIRGLDKLKYLRYLDLSFNKIREIRNLNDMKLVQLNLQNNKIERVITDEKSGLFTLKNLITINLSNNNLKTLKMFKNVDAIQKIIMTKNKINHLIELEHLKELKYLTEVDFRNNPICKQKRYYEMCINLVKPIVLLDGSYISSEEKVLVRCKHNPPVTVEASRRRSNLLLLEKLMKHEVTMTTLSISKAAPPIIVLVGPRGSGQRNLLKEFYEKHERYLKIAISHTTRPKRDDEIDGGDFYFVSDEEFKAINKDGGFMCVSEYLGYFYGLHRSELLKVYDKELVLIFHTDLISALILRMKSLRPVLILTLCFEEEEHYEKLLNNLRYIKWKNYFSDKTDIYRIITSGLTTEDDQSDLSSCAKELYEDVASFLTGDEKQSVSNYENTNPAANESSKSKSSEPQQPSESDENEIPTKQRSERLARSISEQEIGHEPLVLSALSEYLLESDYDDTSSTTTTFKPDEQIERFIGEVINERRQYIEFHQENPGLFMDVIFTDRPEDAYETLKGILKTEVEKKKEPVHSYHYETDPCFEEMLTERLNILYTDMYSEMFVSEDQQPKCWKEHKLHDLEE